MYFHLKSLKMNDSPSKHLSSKSKLCFYLGDGPLPAEQAEQAEQPTFYAVGIGMFVNLVKPYLRYI